MEQVIKAYKGFNPDLTCRGFQYEVGKEYELESGKAVELCYNGFHACLSPLDVLNHYFDLYCNKVFELARFCEVELSGEFDFGDIDGYDGITSKIASSKIKIVKELSVEELILAAVDWVRDNENIDPVDGLCNDSGKDCSIFASDHVFHFVSSGAYAQIASCGSNITIDTSGYNANIGSCGAGVQIFSTEKCANILSSGYDAIIHCCEEFVKICTCGHGANIYSSSCYGRVISSGDSANIVSSGCYSVVKSTGRFANINSYGSNSEVYSSDVCASINASGSKSYVKSSGDNAQIVVSGTDSKVVSTGKDAFIVCTAPNAKVSAKIGSMITLTEFIYGKPPRIKTKIVDGVEIKEDTLYKLSGGEFVSY